MVGGVRSPILLSLATGALLSGSTRFYHGTGRDVTSLRTEYEGSFPVGPVYLTVMLVPFNGSCSGIRPSLAWDVRLTLVGRSSLSNP